MLPALAPQPHYTIPSWPLKPHPSVPSHTVHWPLLTSPPTANAMALQNRMLPLKDLILEDRVRISMAHKFIPPNRASKKTGRGGESDKRPPSIVKRVNWCDSKNAGGIYSCSDEGVKKCCHFASLQGKPCPCMHCYKASLRADRSRLFRKPPNVAKPPEGKTPRGRKKSEIPSSPLFRLGFSTLSLRALVSADKYHQALSEQLELSLRKREVREKKLERGRMKKMSSAQTAHHQITGEELEERWRRREVDGVVRKAIQDMDGDYAARRREYQQIQAYGMKDCMKSSSVLGQKISLANRVMARC